MAQYKYALGSNKSIINVNDLNPSNKNFHSPYICIACGKELIPKLGQKRTKHFAHKSNFSCSNETYLHKLAKYTYYNKYLECLEENNPFIFRGTFPVACNYYQNETGILCHTEEIKDIDLTLYFDKIQIETKYQEFKPDILLSSSKNSHVLFIEIAVTHKCDVRKIDSGIRIIEMNIENENDIDIIKSGMIDETSERVTFYNLNKKEKIKDLCTGDCTKNTYVFLVYKSEKSVLLHIPMKKAVEKSKHKSVIYREFFDNNLNYTQLDIDDNIYKQKVREVYFKGISIRNCYICKYHGIDIYDFPIFCKLKKRGLGSNTAVECGHFAPYNSMKDALNADKTNQQYLNKRLYGIEIIL